MGRNEESFTQQYHGKEVYIDDSLLRIYHFRNHSPSNMNEYSMHSYRPDFGIADDYKSTSNGMYVPFSNFFKQSADVAVLQPSYERLTKTAMKTHYHSGNGLH